MGAFIQSVPQGDLESQVVEFGAWMPDYMNLGNPGACEALNVIPAAGGYAPFNDISLMTGLTLADQCYGAITVNSYNRDVRLYAGTRNGLYLRSSSAFLTKYTTANTLSDYHYWQFIPFGTYLVAVHPEVDTLVVDANTGHLFEELDGYPPRAQCGSRVGDFLVLGNLDNEKDELPRRPSRVRWNGFNRIDLPWVTDPNVQSDYQDMPSEGGEVVAITGREFGTIFQEKMISRMTYTGTDTVFAFETVEEERGALSVGSVVDIGTLIFFIANDGFFVWNGVNTQPIGNDQVNTWFFTNLNYARRRNIIGSHDPINQCIIWAFPTGTSTVLTDQIIYSYKEQKWSHAQKTVEYLLTGPVLAASLDDLTGNLDTDYPISFDDPSYGSGRLRLAGFDNTHSYGTFSGAPLAATIDTSEMGAPAGARLFVNSVRPIVDLTTNIATVQAAVRDQLIGGPLTFGTAVVQEITGECSVLADARFMRLRLNIPAGGSWAHANGIQVWRKALGRA